MGGPVRPGAPGAAPGSTPGLVPLLGDDLHLDERGDLLGQLRAAAGLLGQVGLEHEGDEPVHHPLLAVLDQPGREGGQAQDEEAFVLGMADEGFEQGRGGVAQGGVVALVGDGGSSWADSISRLWVENSSLKSGTGAVVMVLFSLVSRHF